MPQEVLHFTYTDGGSKRLDIYLAGLLPNFSRNRLQALIKEDRVTVNEKVATKTGLALVSGDQVTIVIPEVADTRLVPEAIPLDIIFENSDLLVVNKPAGMVVHPAAGHSTGTLVHAALAHAPELEGIGGEHRPGVVHRLDKDTSGLILVAKNDRAHRYLQDQFRLRKVEKRYIALVDGAPPTPTGRIEASIGRDSARRKQMAVVPDAKGRQALTEYRTLESFSDHTLLEAHPHTGRTHQIRLHLAFIGCPIVGDTIYGRRKTSLPLSRHFLHSARLTVQLPDEEQLRTFEAPLPDELNAVLTKLRNSS